MRRQLGPYGAFSVSVVIYVVHWGELLVTLTQPASDGRDSKGMSVTWFIQHTQAQSRSHTHIHLTHLHTYTHTHMYIYIDIHRHTHTYTYMYLF